MATPPPKLIYSVAATFALSASALLWPIDPPIFGSKIVLNVVPMTIGSMKQLPDIISQHTNVAA